MSKARKISSGHYEYRGFKIAAPIFRKGKWIISDADSTICIARRTLSGCVERIDEWHNQYRHGEVLTVVCAAISKAARLACDRGESLDCPDAHTCRHGIDS